MARLNDMVDYESELMEEMSMIKCTKCGHEFEGEEGDRCPECGCSKTVMMEDIDSNEELVEALHTLIEMIEENALNEDELEVLDSTIDFLSEDFDMDEEDLTEAKKLKKMSAKAKMAARKYRMKNKAKLKMAAKKRKLKDKKLKKKKEACKKKGMVYSKRKGGCARPMERR